MSALVAADLDGDGRSEIIGGDHSGNIYALSPDGSSLFDAKMRADVMALRPADLDSDGRPEILAVSLDGQIAVLDARGSRVAHTAWHSAILSVFTADLDADGRLEAVVAGGRFSAAYSAPAQDARYSLRRTFLGALDAAEQGREEVACQGFDAARLRWLAFDDSGLATIRGRLLTCSGSPSALRMSATLEHVRPTSSLEWIAVVEAVARNGRAAEAIALADQHLRGVPKDGVLAWAAKSAAGQLLESRDRVPGGGEVALVLAQAAAAASEGSHSGILGTLAQALHANGRTADAIAAAEAALGSLAPDDPFRDNLEAMLREYRAALEPGSQPPRVPGSADNR